VFLWGTGKEETRGVITVFKGRLGKIKLGASGMFYGLGPLGWLPDCAAIGSDALVRPVQIAANGGKWDTVNREWHMLQIRYYLQGGRTCWLHADALLLM
jgi:hypothetical protein